MNIPRTLNEKFKIAYNTSIKAYNLCPMSRQELVNWLRMNLCSSIDQAEAVAMQLIYDRKIVGLNGCLEINKKNHKYNEELKSLFEEEKRLLSMAKDLKLRRMTRLNEILGLPTDSGGLCD